MPPTRNERGAHAAHVIDVQVADTRARVPTPQQIRRWAGAALHGRVVRVTLTVRIVGARESRALNRRWRAVDAPTNVLAFAAEGLADIVPGLLGDIVVCAPVVTREARAQGKDHDAHWAHMVIHGTLHLLGFTHERARAARTMEGIECTVLAACGYPDPYAGATHA